MQFSTSFSYSSLEGLIYVVKRSWDSGRVVLEEESRDSRVFKVLIRINSGENRCSGGLRRRDRVPNAHPSEDPNRDDGREMHCESGMVDRW
jgi:hypothetical protein